ncbi:MAG: gamma-glutamyl-gamma-aminobutyrate hydrolase family protein [Planctomycetota bacterium]|jgi:putative glutamine amidotransferase|nr:gamma-glutamyl-gamma-aminobutyrate hydrolase family protein [Planctomycetota bacterium]
MAISMRGAVADYGERRDALASQWCVFLGTTLPGCVVVPIPNMADAARLGTMTDELGLDALILSGGEDWGVYPARDATEQWLFDWASGRGHPVLGVCRGAQVINRLLGGALEPVDGHIAKRHPVRFADGSETEVNSYHGKGVVPGGLAPPLSTIAEARDGSVEAFDWPGRRVLGLMWHPEREDAVRARDQAFMNALFGE